VATVQAVYEDGGAPVSNASLEATLADESPTSTSTTAPTVPSSGGDEPSTEVASGDLPTTGADLAGPLLVAALLLGGGVAFVVISRRRRTP
jgi:LPXTG-motif cell wall-anchored protein